MTTNSSKPLAVLILLFFMWGFITCLNDILVPYLKNIFDLNIFQATLVQFAFFGAYFTGSLAYFLYSYFLGDPINQVGYKKGILFGLLLSAIGCLLFVPASILKMYGLFLFALFILGLGLTALQITANPLVTLIGNPHTASSRLNLAQAFNSFGTTIAPVLGGYFIFEYFAVNGTITAENIRTPYLILAGTFLLVMVIIGFSHIPSYRSGEVGERGLTVLKFGQLRWGIPAIFFYVGGEVAIGSLLINYMGQADVAGFKEVVASKYLAFYWGGAMIGRFLGAVNISDIPWLKKLVYSVLIAVGSFGLVFFTAGLSWTDTWPYAVYVLLNFLMSFLVGNRPDRILSLFSLINVILIALALSGIAGPIWPLLAIGLFNSIMWSNIFSMAIQQLSVYTSQGSSLLVMGVLGGALLPSAQGYVAHHYGYSISFLIPAVCYLYLFAYGIMYQRWMKESPDKSLGN